MSSGSQPRSPPPSARQGAHASHLVYPPTRRTSEGGQRRFPGKEGLMDHRYWARRPPGWLAHTVAAVEDAAALEHTRPLVARLAGPLTRRAALRDVLAGVPIGHALHPLLTDF